MAADSYLRRISPASTVTQNRVKRRSEIVGVQSTGDFAGAGENRRSLFVDYIAASSLLLGLRNNWFSECQIERRPWTVTTVISCLGSASRSVLVYAPVLAGAKLYCSVTEVCEQLAQSRYTAAS